MPSIKFKKNKTKPPEKKEKESPSMTLENNNVNRGHLASERTKINSCKYKWITQNICYSVTKPLQELHRYPNNV